MQLTKLRMGIVYLLVSQSIKSKLWQNHKVEVYEVEECFYNRQKGYLEDIRAINKTNPPTMWFVSETDKMRKLKIVFIELADGSIALKTAYEPNQVEVDIYERHA